MPHACLIVSGKGTREKGTKKRHPGRHQVPHPGRGMPRPGSAVTLNTSGTPVPTSLPSACLESIASARSRDETAPKADTGPSRSSGLHGPPRELWGEAHQRAALRMRQSAVQEAARAASLPPGRRGNGLAGGGAAPRRLLFLPLPVPCGHVAMATELLSSAASRLGWRA
uniref:uncharacterized protein LOC143311475 n=1 Tax=Arvicanthis niloticus TaxID=61156 RepID=UPI00402B722E